MRVDPFCLFVGLIILLSQAGRAVAQDTPNPLETQANQLYSDAQELKDEESLNSRRSAIEKLVLAVQLYIQIGRKDHATVALTDIGELYRELGEMKKALEYLNNALIVTRGGQSG